MDDRSDREGLVPVGGGLLWGIRRSLLGYVRRLPDGRVSIDGDVGLTPTLDFHFPVRDSSEYKPGAASGVLRFGGAVHLFGHRGAMDVTLAEPWLSIDGREAGLSFLASPEGDPGSRAVLFALPWAAPAAGPHGLTWEGLRPRLTQRGADLFQSNYEVGAEFDPVHVRIGPTP